MNIEKIATIGTIIGFIVGGGIWVGTIQANVSNLTKQVEDMKDKTLDQRCLLIVTRQADAITRGKIKALPPLAQLANANGCLKRLDSEGYVVAAATRPATAAELDARRKEREAEERKF